MKKLITLSLALTSSLLSFSQIVESILEGGSGDAQTMLKGYVSPFAKGFGNGINGGWYTTARAHKFLGIDIAVIANAAFVPSSDETFTFVNSEYANIKLDSDPNNPSASSQLPTLFGSKELADRPLLEYTSGGNSLSVSSLPGSGLKEAIDYNVVPSAMIQAGVGLFKKTDLIIRFVPGQKTDEYEFSTFGFGIKHDLKQWIPFVKKLPFDLSVIAAWNDIKSKFFFDPSNKQNQALEFNTKTTMFQLLASKKLAIFTLYGGIGTTSYNTDVNMLGTYTTTNTGKDFTDPIQLSYKGSSIRANIGLSMKLLFLNIAAEYAKQEYDVLTLRVGFSIR